MPLAYEFSKMFGPLENALNISSSFKKNYTPLDGQNDVNSINGNAVLCYMWVLLYLWIRVAFCFELQFLFKYLLFLDPCTI